MQIHKKLFFKKLHFFPIIIYIFIIYIYKTICYTSETDFDYPIKKRLNNGNYLIMSTQGIYLYNEEFNLKKNIIVFESRLVKENKEIYSADIAQFLSEDNGYVICLILNETYIISKKGEYKYHFTIDYGKIEVGNQIIPYGHDDNNHYFIILSIENGIIHMRKYIYDSNIIIFHVL